MQFSQKAPHQKIRERSRVVEKAEAALFALAIPAVYYTFIVAPRRLAAGLRSGFEIKANFSLKVRTDA
ncbi:hypothetical protein HNP46_004210 [Pseudomonas nitritireducens]|uniref:Uncharacterized protein n=1 Tax=Pseudomonas nitroreducens TaxID=46680 RepID=A0A7W7KN13_PSENT|nr:hypothetical protein [Pseudomonas nitritireducens]MBB4865329.1 hypothetical protein [Pseudomonas nitritireducens]